MVRNGGRSEGVHERSVVGDETVTTGGVTVSVMVPALNEIDSIAALVRSIERQTVAPVEVIVADGGSSDGTREWLQHAQLTRPWLVVIDNPDRIAAGALNRCVDIARGDLVARMDAHSTYEPEYIERLSGVFLRHASVVSVGGAMTTRGHGRWGKAIASVLSRRFAMGGAPHRVNGAGGPVAHVFCPMYRRSAIVAVGGFDPTMVANEDFELDCRLHRAGGTVWLEPTARSTWFVRESPKGLSAQMFRYGFFKARTLWLHPSSLQARQLAPPGLVIALAALAVARPRSGVRLFVVYLASVGSAGALAARRDGTSPSRAAAAVPIVHLSWGLGFLRGVVRHGDVRTHGRDSDLARLRNSD